MSQHDLPPVRIPVATYRLQFNRSFRFADATGLVAYLQELGISDIYASPYFQARAGSMHGYDIVDQNRLNPEVGSAADHDRFCAELARHGMGQLLDIVPNHMCIEGGENERWLDLLENGPSSLYADFFDIDWQPVKKELTEKVLLPILGDQYGAILENGELRLAFDEGAFSVRYYEHRLPIIPKTYRAILGHRLDELTRQFPPDYPDFQELMSIINALDHLPPYTEQDEEKIRERYREKEVIKRRLWALYRENPIIREFVETNVTIFNGEPGNSHSFDLLDDLLRQQVYRLSHWRVATEEINYRRFFDINALGAIRMENPRVFEETHRLVLELVRQGKVTGLRVDHADGLYNPADYLHRLQRACFLQSRLALLGEPAANRPPEQGENELEENILQLYDELVEVSPQAKPFFIIGEKILMKGERLPEEWPVYSTTGYEFANAVTGLLVDTRNAREFDTIYNRFVRERMNFAEIAYDKKKLVMQVAMAGEVNTLGHYLNTISEMNRHTRDFTLNSLIKALVEVIACFPVYRTYINSREVNDRDRQYIEYAVAKAKRKNRAMNESIFAFIEDVLLLRFYESTGGRDREEWLNFVMKFQQITGPVMAKGLEDTTFYVYNRLVALNEVGGTPERFGITVEAFHGQNIERAKGQPLALLATSTHDTKRSEDVRARIAVLSEIPGKWRDWLSRWGRLNRHRKIVVDGKPVPDRNEEYLLYQTLLGAWPPGPLSVAGQREFAGRIKEYMLKAMREAKVNTSWINPEPVYEDAVCHFIDRILEERPDNQFRADLLQRLPSLVRCGMLNALSQTLLKIASPGIPDFYQGTELWDFSLVDPDNRRPVDYEKRRAALADLRRQLAETGPLAVARRLSEAPEDGRIKLYLTWQALQFRQRQRRLFEEGKYIPLEVEGERAAHLCAFERYLNEATVLVVAPCSWMELAGETADTPLGAAAWRETRLVVPFETAGRPFRSIFTGERFATERRDGRSTLPLARVLGNFPVALLEGVERE